MAAEDINEIMAAKKQCLGELRNLKFKIKLSEKNRSECNEKVASAKDQRRDINQKIVCAREKLRAILEKKPPELRPYRIIKKELRDLDWRYQTDVFNIATEKKIVKRMQALEEELTAARLAIERKKEIRRLKAEIDRLRADAQARHESLLKEAAESEKHHADLLKLCELEKELTLKLDVLDDKIEQSRAQLIEMRTQRAAEAAIKNAEIKKELAEKAEQIMRDFKNGKKITVQELSILQESGLC